MKTHLLKISVLLLLVAAVWSCRKDRVAAPKQQSNQTLSESSPDLARRLQKLKEKFYKDKLDEKLVPNIDQKLVWVPDWEHAKVQTINDSNSYVFFKLLGYVKQNGKLLEAKEVGGAATYLMVKNERDFYRAAYRASDRSREKSVDLANFSGQLLLSNLKNKQNFLLNYANGKIVVSDANIRLDKLASSDGAGKVPVVASWERYCRTEMRECTFVSSGSINCVGSVYFEVVYSYDCSTPSPVCGVPFYVSDFSYQEVCIDVWFPDPPNPGGGGGGGGGFNAEDPGELYELTIIAESTDLVKRLQCFNGVPTNSATIYSIKICSDIPVNSNPNALLDANRIPGHTFIELTKTNGTNSVTETFGFYPESATKAAFQLDVNSMVVDNQNHDYDASLFFIINANQFEQAINTAKNKSVNDYNMTGYNCTTFALDVFNSARSSNNQLVVPNTVPQNTVVWTYGKTPNGLYKTIMDMKNSGVSGASIAPGTGAISTKCN